MENKEEGLGRKLLKLGLDVLSVKVLMGHSSVAINRALSSLVFKSEKEGIMKEKKGGNQKHGVLEMKRTEFHRWVSEQQYQIS